MDASVVIEERSVSWLAEYARVPIAYTVRSVLQPTAVAAGLGGVKLVEKPVGSPWTKDYDALPDNHPTAWPHQFDMANWGVLSAHRGGVHVGGCVVAHETAGVDLLRSPKHVAVLWDLRVHPGARRAGVGSALFDAAERWAGKRGARWLKVETQNVNVGACRFYAMRGCELSGLNRHAYAELPEEMQLIWTKALSVRSRAEDPTGSTYT